MSSDCVPSQSGDSWAKHLARLAESRRRFPGPEYCEVLRWIHETIRPLSYVEIGYSMDVLYIWHFPQCYQLELIQTLESIGVCPLKPICFV